MSAAADLEELLAKLRSLDKGTTFDEALAMLRPPEPAAVIEIRRRCALVRTLDENVYAELTRDLPDAPAFKDFVASNDVRRLGPQRWAFDELTRNGLLRAWKLTDTDFRNWNGRLARFFLGRNLPEERLDALFHLAASPQPDEGAEYFEKWYAEADANFDLAQCNALLEILRVREATRGTKLTRAWNDHRQFYQARQLFGDDYFKTGAYFERDAPLEKFEQLLKDGSKQWIYHVHATGGTGKTMFLRWLAARYLVPRHIPCARIDFDDFPLSGVLEYPNRIFTRIFDQLASQVPGGVLTALREKLQREQESPGWNSNVPEEIGRQLLGANLETTNLVVMLDTLEDVTRTAKVWLKTCLQALRRLHELHPKLVVVLSGRYDISVHTNALCRGEAVVYELMRFSELEADAYLAKRGIPKGDARTALVKRAGENAELDDDKLAGRNPFKLAMFAELALNKTGLTADMVWKLPRVDIAYLIQRVIMRIQSQPLRWAVRYGVVVRHLNKAVVEAVLLPALKEALRGKTADDPNAALGEFGKVWEPDPALAETVTTDDIWNELKTYARERGWISLSGSEADGTEELRFHPDVVTPTRALLRDQTIYRDLQRHAAEYFHAISGLDAAQVPQDAEAAMRNACEAVFHRFQVDGPAARDYWHANLRKIEERFGLDSAVRYAGEICGPAFALAQVEPIAPFMNAAVLREAHCEAADLLLQTIANRAIVSGVEFTQFQLHVEWAKAVATKHGLPAVPKFLVAIHDAAPAKTGRAIEMLEEARKQTLEPRERVFLTLVLARRVREESPQDSARYLEEALPDLSRARRVWVQTYSIAFELLRLYQSLGDHAGVTRTLDTLRGAAGQQRIFLDPVDQAAAGYALEIGDLETVAACIERLESSSMLPRRFVLTDLQAQLALERGEVLKVITLAREGLSSMADLTDAEGVRADFHALQGTAHKHLLAFTDAFNCFERAGVVYDESGLADGAARSTLLAAQLTAFDLANIHDALSLVDGAAQLRGARDGELYVEFQLLRAYAAYRGGSLDAARELMPELRRRCAGQHPGLRARVAIFEIVFGLETQERRQLELLSAVQAVEPLSARVRVLELCGYSEASLTLTPKVQARLQELFALDAPNSSIHACLDRAHLFRLMGRRDRAIAVLRAFRVEKGASDARHFFTQWLINQALRQLREPTDFRSLLQIVSPMISRTDDLLEAWWDALQVECALEAVRAGDLAAAESIAKVGAPFAALAGQMQPLWLSRIEEVQFYALEHRPPGSHAAQTAEGFEAMGDAVMAQRIIEEWKPFAPQPQMAGAEPPEKSAEPPRMAAAIPPPPPSPPGPPSPAEPPGFGAAAARTRSSLPVHESASETAISESSHDAEILISTTALPELVSGASISNEKAIDIVFSRWHTLADQLSVCIARDMSPELDTFAYEVPPQLSSLPWELAPFIDHCKRYWRKNAHARPPAMVSGHRVNRVLLVRPRQGSGDISLESASGGSLESLYTNRNGAPDFHVLFDPTPEMLIETLQRVRPTIAHINAAMRELQGGIFLDFESTESRADERGARHGVSTKYAQNASVASQRRDLVWSTTRLGRTLQSAPEPLTLVLDIAASSNLTETIRMLLLRNQFANQVFQFAPMCALVGAGLASEYERFELSQVMIEGLLAGGAFGAIRALRDCPTNNVGDLMSALPRLAAALWAHDAHAGASAA